MLPDGGHDVAEVQGSDGATFVLVFQCKRLPRVLQLQLLQQRKKGVWVCYLTQRVCPCDEERRVTRQW